MFNFDQNFRNNTVKKPLEQKFVLAKKEYKKNLNLQKTFFLNLYLSDSHFFVPTYMELLMSHVCIRKLPIRRGIKNKNL